MSSPYLPEPPKGTTGSAAQRMPILVSAVAETLSLLSAVTNKVLYAVSSFNSRDYR